MKYYTITQEIDDNEQTLELIKYFREYKIDFRMAADDSDELGPFGYITPRSKSTPATWHEPYLVNMFVILADESDLTAIRMKFDDICVIKNRTNLKIRNSIRYMFRWMLRD